MSWAPWTPPENTFPMSGGKRASIGKMGAERNTTFSRVEQLHMGKTKWVLVKVGVKEFLILFICCLFILV